MHIPTKQQTRTAMRRERRALTQVQQHRAAEDLARIVSREAFFLRSRRIALYLANDGEIDPAFLRQLAESAGKQTYLPLLHPFRHNCLLFQRHKPGQRLEYNRFAIAEPRLGDGRIVPPWSLDIVFLPLVAFDNGGNRLGMGGGFYDRTFAKVPRRHHFRPLLVGLAHSFQQVESLPREPWDIPLDAIATERGILCLTPELYPGNNPSAQTSASTSPSG
ncbi:MAG: 5-formyltetrahydrofolate cyclo-ligase [Porticoccaceae bacterium]|nr:5-formyltetrahydrofolate cyclo-ligase [Porticoccaceae bacterium]